MKRDFLFKNKERELKTLSLIFIFLVGTFLIPLSLASPFGYDIEQSAGVYTYNINQTNNYGTVNGSVNMLGERIFNSGNITSNGDATYHFGSSLLRWLNGWFVNLFVSGNLTAHDGRFSGQVWINNTLGRAANMNNLIMHLEEMSTNTLLDKSLSTLSVANSVLNCTLYAVDGVGDWNFNGTIYAGPGTSVASATITLTCGTNVTPVTNYVYWELVADVPTMKTSSTYPSGIHIDVATFVVGACEGSNANVYAYSRNRYEVDSFITRVIQRFEESGTLYNSGFNTAANTTQLNITSGGKFFNGIFEMTSTNFVKLTEGFYYINSTGNFVQATNLASFTQYADGSAMTGANLRVNIVWGLVPVNTTGGLGPTQMRLVAVLPNAPTSAYNDVAAAIADIYETTNYYPSNAEVKNVFVPIARTIVRPNTDVFEPFATGIYYKDIRGRITVGGGAATATDTSALVPYTGATANVNLSSNNLSASYLRLNEISGACDLTINHSICANSSGIYVTG